MVTQALDLCSRVSGALFDSTLPNGHFSSALKLQIHACSPAMLPRAIIPTTAFDPEVTPDAHISNSLSVRANTELDDAFALAVFLFLAEG
jgi:hypothetical protein